MSKGQQPVWADRKKNVSVAVFENKGGYKTVTLQKSYKAKEDTEWKKQKVTLGKEELAIVLELLNKSIEKFD